MPKPAHVLALKYGPALVIYPTQKCMHAICYLNCAVFWLRHEVPLSKMVFELCEEHQGIWMDQSLF